ncbi:MAG: hypothetical protein AB7P00_39315, partial [Sandaracinaceae bacterium]
MTQPASTLRRALVARAALVLVAIGGFGCDRGPHPLDWEIALTDPDLDDDIVAYRFAILQGGCPGAPILPDAGVDGGTPEGGTPDASALDGSVVDAGGIDAGALDAGALDPSIDASALDGGRADAGSMDGGATDGGVAPGAVFYEVVLRRGEGSMSTPPLLSRGRWGFMVEGRSSACVTIASGCSELDLPTEETTVRVEVAPVVGARACAPGRCMMGLCEDGDGGLLDGCVPRDESCNQSDDDCDGYVDEEYDFDGDVMNCGRCGNTCVAPPNALVSCESGGCVTQCQDGFTFCDGDMGPCETDLSQPEHCGVCGNVCTPALPICGLVGGVRTCVDHCEVGQTMCGSSCIDTDTDPSHCGGCNQPCTPANAIGACVDGTCGIAACQPDFGDCNSDPSDGCEVPTRMSDAHCGGCGRPCGLCQQCTAAACGARAEGSSCTDGSGVCLGGMCCQGCLTRGAGTCSPGNTPSECGSGGGTCGTCTDPCQTCATGTCAPVPNGRPCGGGLCNAGSCCTGCVNAAGECRFATFAECGTGGEACHVCECSADTCDSSGQCRPNNSATAIASGDQHTCVIVSGGQLYCWGDNSFNQQNGPDPTYPTPRRPAGTNTYGIVGAGYLFTCAVRGGASDTLHCWGDNREHQISSSSNPTEPLTLLDSNWLGGSLPLGLGAGHGCHNDTGLECWGDNALGQLGLSPPGGNVAPPSMTVLASSGYVPAAGGGHTCVLRSGSIQCTGDDSDGQLGNGSVGSTSTFTNVSGGPASWTSVTAGSAHSCGTGADGSLWCWGDNAYGQLGNGTMGVDEQSPVRVGTDLDWMRVYAGLRHTCAIKSSGLLFCWGDNAGGQIGNGAVGPPTLLPSAVGAASWLEIAPGGIHSCGIQSSGAVYCWGQNAQG